MGTGVGMAGGDGVGCEVMGSDDGCTDGLTDGLAEGWAPKSKKHIEAIL